MSSCGCNNGGGCSPKTSGCSILLGSECVTYQGGSPLIQIGGTFGERLETILRNIDSKFKSIVEQIQDGFIGQNVGGGVEVYKGLNADGIGELRTLRSTDSILVTNTDDTISFAVKTSFISGIIDPILIDIQDLKDSVASINAKLVIYDSDIAALKAKDTTHDALISDLQQKYLNLQQDVTNLHTEVNGIHDEVVRLKTDMTQAQSDISALQNSVSEINTKISSYSATYMDEFQGLSIISLPRPTIKILGVWYNGIFLPRAQYSFQAPNQVALQLGSVNLSVAPEDFVQIMYSSNS